MEDIIIVLLFICTLILFGFSFVYEMKAVDSPDPNAKKVAHEVPHNIGVYVSIPIESDKLKEFEHPTPLSNDLKAWKLIEFQAAYSIGRKRSMNELFFCMFRAGHKNAMKHIHVD